MSYLTVQSRENAQVIIRMLHYCSEPKLATQIKSYCDIDSIQFSKFTDHCVKRGILKRFIAEEGQFSYIITENGRRILTTTQELMKALSIGL